MDFRYLLLIFIQVLILSITFGDNAKKSSGKAVNRNHKHFAKSGRQGAPNTLLLPAKFLEKFSKPSDEAQKLSAAGLAVENAEIDNGNVPTIAGSVVPSQKPNCDGPTPLRMSANEVNGKTPDCVKKKYREINGFCNNPIKTNWGNAATPLIRLAPTDYDDNKKTPRTKGLPNVRTVSAELLQNDKGDDNINNDDPHLSNMFTHFGQFIDHDITSTPQPSGLNCCPPSNPECFPIDVSKDPTYSANSITCLTFVRSSPTHFEGCQKPRQQIDQITHFIDGSQIYGSKESEANDLRDLSTGKLKSISITGTHPVLPNNGFVNAETCANSPDNTGCAFKAGDQRVDEIPVLTLLHIIFLRDHNDIVNGLKGVGWLNPEELYQEARKIVTAKFQLIIFKHFLPILIKSPEVKKKYPGVELQNPSKYDPLLNPSISNEFATAAFRYGHSMIRTDMALHTESNGVTVLPLHTQFFNNTKFYRNGIVEQIAGGACADHAQKFDNIVSDSIHNRLFAAINQLGFDLISFNLQRARDHGVSSCNKVREFLGLPKVNLPDPKIKTVYSDPDKMDLFACGLLEDRNGNVIGPTFEHIIADAFNRLKTGDRFMFTHEHNSKSGLASPFTSDQRREIIDKTTLSGLICRNTDLAKICPNSFIVCSDSEKVDCRDLEKKTMLDLSKFSPDKQPKPSGEVPSDLKKFIQSF